MIAGDLALARSCRRLGRGPASAARDRTRRRPRRVPPGHPLVSTASWGYFPTYTLGAMIAAQLFEAAREAIPELTAAIACGDFRPLFAWLREQVHGRGSLMSTAELVESATGAPARHREFRAPSARAAIWKAETNPLSGALTRHNETISGGHRARQRCAQQPDGCTDRQVALARFEAVRRRQRGACRQSDARGPDDPVDARCQPDQVASGAHHLVFRDLHPEPARPRLPGLRSGFRLSVQFLLRGGRARVIRGPQRGLAVAPDGRDRRRLSRPCRRGDGALRRARGRAGLARGCAADRARPPSRAAASGTDPDGHQARLLAQSAAAGLSGAAAADRRRRGARSAGVEFAGGLRRDRPCAAPAFAFDNEDAAAQGLARTVPPRRASGDLRRVSSTSSRTAAIASPNSGCRTAGRRCSARAGRRRSIGAREDGGWSHLHACRAAPARPGRAGLPCQLLRGRRLCAMGRQAAADRSRVGGRRRRRVPLAGNLADRGHFIPAPTRRQRRDRAAHGRAR